MVQSRHRLAAGICFMLTLGTVVNVIILQGGRKPPEAAAAAIAPSLATPEKPLTPTSLTQRLPPPAADPVSSLMASADADLAMRTTDGAEAIASDPGIDDASDNDKLISAIQRELAAHGYDPGKVNGKAGIVTRSAILAFEFDHHMALTAEPSSELLRQIVMGMAGPAASANEPAGDKASRIIAGAQRLLVRLGYKPGPVDGQLNDATRKALKKFESESGFVPKGRVSGEVIAELARQSHARIEVTDEALAH